MPDTLNEVKRRKKQVTDIVFSTPRQRIQQERQKSKNDDFAKDYLELLKLPDQEILRQILDENRYFYYNFYCQICGQGFAIDECFVLLDFSFCSQYSCEMTFHLDCSELKSKDCGTE